MFRALEVPVSCKQNHCNLCESDREKLERIPSGATVTVVKARRNEDLELQLLRRCEALICLQMPENVTALSGLSEHFSMQQALDMENRPEDANLELFQTYFFRQILHQLFVSN